MIFTIKGTNYEVPIERLHAALTVYDEWLRGQAGREFTRQEFLSKVTEIAALLAPRQYIEDGKLKYDYYAPDRLRRVILSELGKRKKKKKSSSQEETLFAGI